MDIEILKHHRAFKKDILDVIFTHFETFYIHCMPHPDLLIGMRGLQDKEKQEGIVLVFGPHSNRNLGWDEKALYCELQFNKWEAVQIPYECISRIFDKEGQVIINCATVQQESEADSKKGKSRRSAKAGKGDSESKVIEVDFRKGQDDQV